jgi:WD domain, G-beta repeat
VEAAQVTFTIRHADYHSIGDVTGALAKRAQEIYYTETDQEKNKVAITNFRRLFTHLVALGEPAAGTQDTRQVVGREELDAETWKLAQRLANEDNRLVVIAAAVPGNETVEIVHQALIRNWPTLVEWLDRERAFRSWRLQLGTHLENWHASQSEDNLLRGGPLAIAEDWIAQRGDEVRENERAFVFASARARTRKMLRLPLATAAGLAIIFALIGSELITTQRQRERALEASQLTLTAAQEDLHRGRANLLGELARVKRAEGDIYAALRFAAKGVEDDLRLPPRSSETTVSMSALADAAAQSNSVAVGGPRIPRPDEETTYAAGFSPDGKRIVTASGNVARVWDAATGAPLGEPLRGHEGPVMSASFSPDGMRIVTGSDDETARLWDAATGAPLGEPLRGHEGPVMSASFSADGTRIVTASDDKTARVWDAADGKEIAILIGHEGPVLSAAFSPDGKRIVTASDDETVRVWDPATARLIGTPLQAHPEPIYTANFSPDGSRILAASGNGARVWDVATGSTVATFLNQGRPLLSASFSPDGSRIITASGRNARIFETSTGRDVAILSDGKSDVTFASFSPDGSRAVTVSPSKGARIWDLAFKKLSPTGILKEVCTSTLRARSTMTRDEMRLAGYPDSEPLIDVCGGVAGAGP